MNIVAYTIFDTTTGEICGNGSAVKGTAHVPEGCSIWEGAALFPGQHIFGEDGAPMLRPSPLLRTQHELSLDINRERQRRIEAGKIFDGMLVTGSDRDQVNLLALKDTARDLLAAGVTGAVIPFRDGNNVEHNLTAGQIIDLANAGKEYVSAIYQASWALKAMDPIPQNVNSNTWWPE